MATTYFSSQASALKVLISSVSTNVPGVVSLTVPSIKLAFDDITNLGSTAGFPERAAVGKEFVDMTVPLIWDPSNAAHDFLLAAAINQLLCTFAVICSDATATQFNFTGYVQFEPQLEANRSARVNMTINITGAITTT